MNKYITIEEHDQFIELKNKFDKCLAQCGKEIYKMQYGHELSEWYVNDYELHSNDIYLVWFENSFDSEFKTIEIPIMYMCDELFRQNYGSYLDEQRRIKEETKKIEEQKKKDENSRNREIHDREEYARLKRKYEDSEQWK